MEINGDFLCITEPAFAFLWWGDVVFGTRADDPEQPPLEGVFVEALYNELPFHLEQDGVLYEFDTLCITRESASRVLGRLMPARKLLDKDTLEQIDFWIKEDK